MVSVRRNLQDSSSLPSELFGIYTCEFEFPSSAPNTVFHSAFEHFAVTVCVWAWVGVRVDWSAY
jgi:hypothetical protein